MEIGLILVLLFPSCQTQPDRTAVTTCSTHSTPTRTGETRGESMRAIPGQRHLMIVDQRTITHRHMARSPHILISKCVYHKNTMRNQLIAVCNIFYSLTTLTEFIFFKCQLFNVSKYCVYKLQKHGRDSLKSQI